MTTDSRFTKRTSPKLNDVDVSIMYSLLAGDEQPITLTFKNDVGDNTPLVMRVEMSKYEAQSLSVRLQDVLVSLKAIQMNLKTARKG